MRLRHLCLFAAAGFAMLAAALPARAALLIEVDKATQQMTVSRDGETLYTWPVSTGIASYDTPSGDYKPFRMERDHFSREWDDAPMPNSIFFTAKGHAIHGTEHLRNIGRPASHGCVRLEPKNARVLFDLVRLEKMANTRVVLTGEIPAGEAPAVAAVCLVALGALPAAATLLIEIDKSTQRMTVVRDGWWHMSIPCGNDP